MLIIVEGTNGVGKSTFIERLRRRMDELSPPGQHEVRVLHKGPPTEDTMVEEYELPLQDYRPNTWKHVICDRWHLGEEVYGPLLRDGSQLTRPELRHINLFLESKGAVIVHLLANTETLLRRRTAREKQELVSDDQVPAIIDGFLDAIWDSTVNTIEVMWEDDLDTPWNREQIDRVIELAIDRSLEACHLDPYTTYVGSPRVETLILGERRNQNNDRRWDAAFVPLPNSSGEYLLRHLPESVVMSSGIANAVEEYHHLGDLLAELRYPRTVALGRVAHEALDRIDYQHGSAPHPQYVRRFHHHHGPEYGRVIRRALVLQEDHLSWRPTIST